MHIVEVYPECYLPKNFIEDTHAILKINSILNIPSEINRATIGNDVFNKNLTTHFSKNCLPNKLSHLLLISTAITQSFSFIKDAISLH